MPAASNKAASNPEGVTPYAARLPRPKKSGDTERDSEAVAEHKAFQKLVSILEKAQNSDDAASRGLVMHALNYVQGKIERDAAADDNQFDANVTCIGKLPPSWTAAWLMAMCPALTQDKLQLIAKNGADGLSHLYAYALQLPRGFAIPPQCKEKRVCYRVMSLVWERFGKRMSNEWMSTHIAKNGDVDWLKGGCYWFSFAEDGRAKTVHHVSGLSVDLAEHIFISKKFAITENWCDASASVRYDDGPQPVKYLCMDLFPKTAPFYQLVIKKNKHPAVDEMAKQAALTLQQELEKARAGELQVEEQLLTTPAKERKAQAVEKARVARTVASEEKQKKRRVCLA